MSDTGSRRPVRFVGPGEPADVAVVVVTYQSAQHLPRLLASLHEEATATRLRVVVADNASTDRSLELARADHGVVAVSSGDNVGYAAAINLALRHVDPCDAVLVLNPDLTLEPGCIAALRHRLQSSRAGVVVPRILTGDGALSSSLRYEPSLTRAVGDAFLGGHMPRRPAWLGETLLRREAYAEAHQVDWATGAALLVDRRASLVVGDWDEQFFLYSEETDYFRRTRESGLSVWYEPGAVVRHDEGGSGSSLALARLMAVNRVRYFSKHHGPLATAAFRAAVVLHEGIRVTSAPHRAAFRAVASRRSWSSLPRAQGGAHTAEHATTTVLQ